MTCSLFHSTEMPNERAKVFGTPPAKPMRWAVDYVVKTPDGRTVVLGEKTIQRATFEELRAVMDHTIGDEVGNVATFVSWRATAHGGKKRRKGGKRKCS
ncbi:hypothetical protein SAMN04244579_00339 [Azotobacter beijerinckii]|uniref:Uncharacterized protein n=1 Tax=Azotobacter beijerinckii TaxID=170623 RepID=A0A1H6QLT3_9GAMM|nr:hypothetical protein [Azotobacter beijerinckii]SEI41974.1 hypothetical protein SAMN04244579_00339 [Azotobacter beijerinckii]